MSALTIDTFVDATPVGVSLAPRGQILMVHVAALKRVKLHVLLAGA